MPQEFQVLQCFRCQTFQVHQVKKALKWACKLCGEKQSIKKVYGRGTGAECRQHVQRLNTMRGEVDAVKDRYQTLLPVHLGDTEHDEEYCVLDAGSHQYSVAGDTKWGQFVEVLDVPTEHEGHEDGDGAMYTTDAKVFTKTNKERKRKWQNELQATRKCSKWSQSSQNHDGRQPLQADSFTHQEVQSDINNGHHPLQTGSFTHQEYQSNINKSQKLFVNQPDIQLNVQSQKSKVKPPEFQQRLQPKVQTSATISKWDIFGQTESPSEEEGSSSEDYLLESSTETTDDRLYVTYSDDEKEINQQDLDLPNNDLTEKKMSKWGGFISHGKENLDKRKESSVKNIATNASNGDKATTRTNAISSKWAKYSKVDDHYVDSDNYSVDRRNNASGKHVMPAQRVSTLAENKISNVGNVQSSRAIPSSQAGTIFSVGDLNDDDFEL